MRNPTPETKEATHRRFYEVFHDWFMQSGCDFWSEYNAPESLATIAVELCDAFAVQALAEISRLKTGFSDINKALLASAEHDKAVYLQGATDMKEKAIRIFGAIVVPNSGKIPAGRVADVIDEIRALATTTEAS